MQLEKYIKMTRAEFQKFLQEWCLADADGQDGIEDLKRDVEFLERELFHEYSVTAYGGHGDFGARLARWIACADSDADRKTLYIILRHLFFIGNDEIRAAYRTAYSKNVLQWLIGVAEIDLFHKDSTKEVQLQVKNTCFTEITDSFKISDFLKINQIQGESIRFRWSGNIGNWRYDNFISSVLREGNPDNPQKRNIVLLEDFVGSGSQAMDSIKLACSLGSDYNVLFCPLFICPEGAKLSRRLERTNNNFTFSPVLEFEERFFLPEDRSQNEHIDFEKIRQCIKRLHPKLAGGPQDYGPFGYQKTGAIIVQASNCPDNTLPVLHRKGQGTWEPLFLRNSREVI